MLKYLLPVLVVLMLNTVPLQIFKKKFGEVLPITLISVPIILFITQFIFKSFTPGIILICVIALGGTVLLFIRRKSFADYFSNGFFAFLAVALLVTILDFRRSFSDFDEFWHWGPMVKEMLRLDRFYCVDASRMVIHKDYPPFPALYEVFAAKVGLGYNEGGINAALHIMCFSILVSPIADKINFEKKKILKSVIFGAALCGIFLCIAAFFDVPGITLTILGDFPLAAFFALSIFLILSGDAYESKAGLVSFIMTCIMLTMTKQVGLPIMLVSILMFVLVGFVTKKKKPLVLITGCAGVALPMAFYLIWSKYVAALGVSDIRSDGVGNGQFSLAKISLRVYLDAALQRSSVGGIQELTFWSLIRAFFERKITSGWLPLSYMTAFALVILIIVLTAIFFKKDFKPGKGIAVGAALTVGTIGYAFMLSVLFLFCFTPDEMQDLRGYERYVDSFIAGEVIGLILLIILLLNKNKKIFEKSNTIVIALLVSLIFVGTALYRVAPALTKQVDYEYKNMADFASAYTEPDSDVIMVYNPSSYNSWYGGLQARVYYYDNDRDFPLDTDLYNLALYGINVAEVLTSRLTQSDKPCYIYVLQTNEVLDSYLAPAAGTETLGSETVYRVSLDNGALQLTRTNN